MIHARKDLLSYVIVAGLLFSTLFFIGNVHAEGTPSVCPYVWNRNLKVGSSGEDVRSLQKMLNSDPATAVATSGDGSLGKETTRFGPMTSKAVSKFQEKYSQEILAPNGLSSGTGNVGISTRATLNSLCKVTSVIPVSQTASAVQATSASGLTVSADAQPSPTLAPRGAIYIPFTNVVLTAGAEDVTVNSITVRRTGLSKNGAFAALDLLDENFVILSTAYLHSDNTATFRDSFTIPAGTSMNVSVTAEMAVDLTDYDAQQAFFQVIAVDASAPVTGTLPITGVGHIINNSLSIGQTTASLSSFDPGVDQTKYINDTGVRFSGIRITTDSREDVRLDSITWNQSGTANGSDIANVVTVINGVRYPTEIDERYYTSIFPDGIIIKKGDAIDAYVEGDLLTTGSGRTVKFDIRWPTDVYVTGLTYGYGIYTIPGGNTNTSGNSVFLTDTGDTDGISLQPFFSGSAVTVSGAAETYIGKN